MDEPALRLEEIRIQVQTNGRLVDLKARRHVAVFAVGLTSAAGAAGALALGHVQPAPAVLLAAGAGSVVATQVRALGRLEVRLERVRDAARSAIGKLIAEEEETAC